jgi:hypothetical protein
MDFATMIVSVVAISCTAGLGFAVVNTIKTALEGRGRRANEALATEVRELREEIRQLRIQNNDIILALDPPASSVARRHVVEPEHQVLHRG